MIKHVTGNIFDSERHTIVNAVNCVGVMGAGIALEYRLRYPDMFEKYQSFCENNLLDIGKLWIYKPENGPWILNFPTKKHWKYPTKEEYLRKGLSKFLSEYKEKGIQSIAFPLLGADKGGLGKDKSMTLLQEYLSELDIDVDIYQYDPQAADSLCEKIKNIVLNCSPSEYSHIVKFGKVELEKLQIHLTEPSIKQISNLLKIRGIGNKTVEKLYQLGDFTPKSHQPSLL
ncbi:macro domain-containing protein [Photobacterium leiognathi]|uniref:macro domain-containing protein n=1 Tax=Photobacterium leiognathi TaxID=553611 RepID=UPI0029815518|nr:macro domain-containing protein [Photobacterium leiognathi]